MRVLGHVVVKELLQLRRDRKMIPMMVVGPLAQLLVLGYAANNDVNRVPTVVVDQDRSAQSRVLAERFLSSRYFERVGSLDSVSGLEDWLVSGRAQVALVIAPRYGANLLAHRRPRVQVIADGTDSTSAVVGLAYASAIVAGVGAELVQGWISRGPAAGRIVLVPRVWYNPDLLSRWFYVPAILAMVLLLVTLILPSMAIVREKEIGTLEQLIVTPVRPWQLIAGKLVPFVLIGFLDTLLVSAVAVNLFGVPLRGSFALLLALTVLFLMNTLGLGLLVSSLVRTQQQAMMTATFLIMVPMIYLSGLIFPIENMPRPIQWVTLVIPLRYYAIIIRGIFLKGAGIADLWPEAATLFGMGAFVLVVASLRFRKSLD